MYTGFFDYLFNDNYIHFFSIILSILCLLIFKNRIKYLALVFLASSTLILYSPSRAFDLPSVLLWLSVAVLFGLEGTIIGFLYFIPMFSKILYFIFGYEIHAFHNLELISANILISLYLLISKKKDYFVAAILIFVSFSWYHKHFDLIYGGILLIYIIAVYRNFRPENLYLFIRKRLQND